MYLSRRGVACVGFALLGALLSRVSALPTIKVKGSKFFTSEGDQFYIKGSLAFFFAFYFWATVSYPNTNLHIGVVYQTSLTTTNNLVNGTQCRIDAEAIAKLGANVVRVYTVEPTLNHDECMTAFDEKGIYLMLDMATPEYSINRADPSYDEKLRNAFAQVLDGFHKYDNLLGLFVGNEVVNSGTFALLSNSAKTCIY
jgi:hypothetical protein